MQTLNTSGAPKKNFREASAQCDSTGGDSMSGRTPPPARKACHKESIVPFPELATCRLMDWPEGLQAGESFTAQRASHVRFEFEARSAPQGSRPPRPPAPSPSLLKPCLHSRPISVPAQSADQLTNSISVISIACKTTCG